MNLSHTHRIRHDTYQAVHGAAQVSAEGACFKARSGSVDVVISSRNGRLGE
ncbi:Unknown protein sequence [Pseudomonas amygdali pv. lachrymans]|uniref:Uncharacterized protein n=1 Tax=Pseudomonas amygdali pv. lachrymans TaxID=53707 RepID=A0A0P9TIN7_PSEAV|nr:Unknown protein sequence [Pseudomonas amygdali pv. lachrymans]